MDNLTHTLVGATAAEFALYLFSKKNREPTPKLRRTLWLTSIAANNIPDLDFIYGSISGPDIGMLLHHRGHTHTFIAAPLLAALVLAIVFLFSKIRKFHFKRKEWLLITKIAVLGCLLHTICDMWNSYGTHALWPFYNGWQYGDFVFIIEPYLWALMLPPLIFATEKKTQKVFVGIFGITSVIPWTAIFLGFNVIHWPFALMLTLFTVVWFLVIRNLYERKKLQPFFRISAVSAVLLFLCISFACRGLADRKMRAIVTSNVPSGRIDEIILSPMPANLVCWQAITIETSGTPIRYSLRRAVLSIAPFLVSANHCPDRIEEDFETFIKPVPFENSASIFWKGQFDAPLLELRALVSRYCGVRAFLHVARAPYWFLDGDRVVFGDFRFVGRPGPRKNFATLEDLETCPAYVPNWDPPRLKIITDLSTVD